MENLIIFIFEQLSHILIFNIFFHNYFLLHLERHAAEYA